jgi:hypothetical protein
MPRALPSLHASSPQTLNRFQPLTRPLFAHYATAGGRCHETDIISSFRAFYPRYRRRDMTGTADGVSLSDSEVGELVRAWNARMGRPAERTPAGYWKGVSVVSPRGSLSDVF